MSGSSGITRGTRWGRRLVSALQKDARLVMIVRSSRGGRHVVVSAQAVVGVQATTLRRVKVYGAHAAVRLRQGVVVLPLTVMLVSMRPGRATAVASVDHGRGENELSVAVASENCRKAGSVTVEICRKMSRETPRKRVSWALGYTAWCCTYTKDD